MEGYLVHIGLTLDDNINKFTGNSLTVFATDLANGGGDLDKCKKEINNF
jgi:hypothetical protein